ncbi:hypothetical protein CsSME_00011833 [Camellia sinensis var. sinensis]
MKSISLPKLGLNETKVYGGELMASPIEATMYHHINLMVDPKREDSSNATPKQDKSNNVESKDNEGSDNRDGIYGDTVDLNDVNDDINTSFNSPNVKRGIIIAQPSELDIVDMLIEKKPKILGFLTTMGSKIQTLGRIIEVEGKGDRCT